MSGNPDSDSPVQGVPAIPASAATFQINNAKLYVPVVTLPINDNIKFLENIQQALEEQFLGTNIDLK